MYVGLAGTSLRTRVRDYYKTPLGARRPHAGGWFLKTLSNINDLYVHYAQTDTPNAVEDKMLRAFCAGVSERARAALHDPAHPFPFANLEWPPGFRKAHGKRTMRTIKTYLRPPLRGALRDQGRSRRPLIRKRSTRTMTSAASREHARATSGRLRAQRSAISSNDIPFSSILLIRMRQP